MVFGIIITVITVVVLRIDTRAKICTWGGQLAFFSIENLAGVDKKELASK